MSLADQLAAGVWLEEEVPQEERDQWGRTRKEALAEYLAFTRDRPTFERGRDRWGDFTVRFRGAARDYGVTEEQAKRVGQSDEARGWSDEGTVAALEFSQPSLCRIGTGTW